MSDSDCEMTFGEGWEREVFGPGTGWERELHKQGLDLVAHAIPHFGVDSADLQNSAGYAIVDGEAGSVEMIAGSNPETGNPVPYAGAHMVGGKAGAALDDPPDGPERKRKRRPHPTKGNGTKPFTKAQQELYGSAPYGNLPGGLEG